MRDKVSRMNGSKLSWRIKQVNINLIKQVRNFFYEEINKIVDFCLQSVLQQLKHMISWTVVNLERCFLFALCTGRNLL